MAPRRRRVPAVDLPPPPTPRVHHTSAVDFPVPPAPVDELSRIFSAVSIQSTADNKSASTLDLHSPLKFMQRPSPRTKEPRWIPRLTATPSRAKHPRTVEFKLRGPCVGSSHGGISKAGKQRAPTREETRRRFGLKSVAQISRWKSVDNSSLVHTVPASGRTFNDMKSWQLQVEIYCRLGKAQRICQSAPRWKALEKALVIAFAERRLLGRVVRRKWFERTATQVWLHSLLATQLRLHSPLATHV
jgi:hypothetical protein